MKGYVFHGPGQGAWEKVADPGIEETMKWGMPSFNHAGIVCNMAAFKQHCAFGFWKSKLILVADIDDRQLLKRVERLLDDHGVRLVEANELPSFTARPGRTGSTAVRISTSFLAGTATTRSTAIAAATWSAAMLRASGG